MQFLNLLLLFVIFKIDRPEAIESASLLFNNSAEVEMENLMTEFISDVKKFGYEKINHHRLIVLGKKDNFLQTTKILLESGVPYFISTKAEGIVLPWHFGTDSFVLFFVDGYSESEMKSIFAKVPNNYKYKALLISVEENRTDESMMTIMDSAVEVNVRNILFAHFDGQVIKISEKVMYTSCDPEITLVNTWTPKKGFRDDTRVFDHEVLSNELSCPTFVSTLELIPTMKLRRDKNDSLHIAGGLEGRLVQSITKYVNMVPVVKVPFINEKFGISPDGTVSGIVGDVARKVARFGIGQIRPTLERAKLVDLTETYNHECMVWTVPLKTKYNHTVVISAFSSFTWIVVILSVSLCCGLVHVASRLKIGCGSPLNIFDVIAMTLNYAIPRHPSGVLCKLFFLVYLHYSRVICTAYSTSLSSILTTTLPEPEIVDEEGILAAGLRTAGTRSSREMLADQISPNSTRAELINRYEVITSAVDALARIADRQDIAYLRHRSTIIHIANRLLMEGKPVKFYPLPFCVISYNSVMVTWKGSRLTGLVNNIIRRLREAGIYGHWLSMDHSYESPIRTLVYNDLTLFQLKSVFVLYLFCLIPAFLAFAAELIAFKLKLDWFTR